MRSTMAATLLAAVLCLAGCGGTPGGAAPAGGPKTQGPVALALGYPAPSGTFLPWVVAADQGLFARNGLKVSMKQLAGSGTETPALLSGGVQAVVIDANSALTTIAKGAPVVLVANTFNGYAFELWAKPGIATIADLKGKTLGLEHVASLSDSGAHALFAKLGLPFTDVQAEYLGNDQTAVAALIDGKVDAAISSPPAIFEAEAKGFHQLYNLDRLPHVANAVEVTRAFVRQHPAEVGALLKSYMEADAFIRDAANKPKVTGDLAGFTKLTDPSLLDKTYAYFAQSLLCDPAIAPSQLTDAVAWAKKYAHVAVDPNSALDLAPLQALQASGFVRATCG